MRDLIGIPWAVPCNPPDTYDCWELVRTIRARHGVDTPSYVDRLKRTPNDRARWIETMPLGWFELTAPMRLCVVRMFRGRHVGVYLDAESVIHCQFGSGVRIDRPCDLAQSGELTWWEMSDD